MDPLLHLAIVAQDPWVRAGLAAMLDVTGMSVVGQSATLAETDVFGPDVVLWDFNADERGETAGVPVLALIQDEGAATRALGADVTGVLFRDADADKVLAALQATAQGLVVLEPALTTVLREPLAALEADPLTAREHEVLQQLAQGASNKAIAKVLEISESTAKFHTSAVLSKLGVRSRTEAVVRAARLGLILL